MNRRRHRADGMARRARRTLRAGLAVAVLSGLLAPPIQAGEGLARVSARFGRKAEAPAEAKPGPTASPLRWWTIPRTARVAARKLAATEDAAVTRCLAIEHDDQITYEIHAARRIGLLRKQDFVLTRVSEPKAVAEKRRQDQSLRRRLGRLRDAAWSESPSTHGSR